MSEGGGNIGSGSSAPAATGGGGSSSGSGSPSPSSGAKPVSATTSGTGIVAARAAAAKPSPVAQPQQAVGGESTEGLTPTEKRELLELDIDGETIEYDYTDREKLKRDLQRRFGAEKRMAEASRMRKETESFVEQLRANPMAALARLGVDPRQVSETYLKAQIEEEMLKEANPGAWELAQERKQFESERNEVEQYKQQEQQRQFQVQQQQASQRYEKKFMEALQLGGLPKTPFTVKRMAEYQRQAKTDGYDLDATELAELVRNDFTKDIRETLGGADAKTLIALLGDDLATKLREADLARFQRPSSNANTQGKATSGRKAAPTRMTMQEFLSRNS